MIITRETLIHKLAEESGYCIGDIRALLKCLDAVVLDCCDEVTEDEDVSLQIINGIKIGCSVVPERTRKDPRTQEDIVCASTVKPNAKFSRDFRAKIQSRYEKRKDG